LRAVELPRRVALLFGLLGLGILSSLPAAAWSPPIHVVTTPVASSPWLDRLNQWRTSTGLPALTENTTWSQGDYDHSLYMVKNDLVTHYETPGVPYYTTAGDAAAQNGNIQVSSTTSTTDTYAIDWWMAAPFHAMGMMDPRLTQTGFGSYRQVKSGWDAGFTVDTLRGNSFSGGKYPVYFPGNGTTEPLTSYGGGEFPDPLSICKPYAAPTGLPVFIQVGGNVNTTAGPNHTFTGNGVPLNHCIIDSSAAPVQSYLYTRGAVILVPQQPLKTGVKYAVSLTVNGVAYSWSFTLGPFCGVTGVSPNTGAAFGGTPVTITGTGFSNGTTSVMFGGSPAASYSVVDDNTITAVSPAHASGPVDVTVTTAMGTSVISAADVFTFGCNTASLTPSSGSFVAGSLIGFTAGSGGCPSPRYEFWVQDPSATWTLKQSFGGPAFSWDTSLLAPGTYVVHAWVNGQGTGHDAIGEAIVTLTGCTSASVSPPAVSQLPGSTVNLTASSGGCPNPVYEFWVQDPSGTWTLKQGFGGASFSWPTTGLAAGTYLVHAWANQQGAAPTLEVYGSSTVTLVSCASASVSPPSAGQPAGSTFQFTATSSGCGSPQYEFWVQYPDLSWNLLQPFSGSATFSWNTAGLAPGAYTVHAWASAGGAGHDSIGSAAVTLTGCTTATVAPPSQSAPAGTVVNMTGGGSAGCPNPQFEYWVQYPDTSWHLLRPWGAAAWGWDTTGLKPGTYTVHAWTNQTGASIATYEAIGSETVTLSGCTAASLSPASGSAAAGATIPFTASSTCTGTAAYEFWLQYPDGTWHQQTNFTTTSSWSWTSTGRAKGSYVIHVWVNNQNADTSTYETIGSATYTLS
jgi:hypothetical protein